MKVIAATDDYTVYQKRNQRYAVRRADRQWVNGDAKVEILLAHQLIEAPKVKAPEPEAPEETTDAADAEAGEAEAAADDAQAEAEES